MQEIPNNAEQKNAIMQAAHQEIDILKKIDFYHPRVIPALTLYAYNFFATHTSPTEEEKLHFHETCRQLSRQENDMEADPLHTTVGAEIEWFISRTVEDLLHELYENDPNGLRISSADDEDPNNSLQEIGLPWTHSAATQAFMIGQLQQLGAFATPTNATELPATRIGLHYNMEIPSDITQGQIDDSRTQKQLKDMNDALIIAFTSEERLQERKSRATYTTDKETEASKEASKQGAAGKMHFRLELRAMEVNETNFQDLLQNTQYLGIGFFQWIQTHIPGAETTSERTNEAASQFEVFAHRMAVIRNTYNIPTDFANARTPEQKDHAIKIVLNESAVAAVRALVEETSKAIKNTIDQDNDQ